MYYSAIGVLAAMVLLIENQDILFNRSGIFGMPAWKIYRRFLFAVLCYYITDVLWGVLESLKMGSGIIIDTSAYFIAVAAGVLFWTRFAVAYLEEKDAFGRFLEYAGRGIAAVVVVLVAVNAFVPVIFYVDGTGNYHTLPARSVILYPQILLLLLLCAYMFYFLIAKRKTLLDASGPNHPESMELLKKRRTLAFFGVIMAVFLYLQLLYPFLPFYSVAYLLGTCLLRASIIGDEKGRYMAELAGAERTAELKESFSALLDNMPVLSFSKDARTGVYLACNQAFAEYAHKENPEGVVGLTDAEIFDLATASHFVEDDRIAVSMDEPYIFFENVPDAAGNPRRFQTTKLKFTDQSGRLCTLGMCQDVTDMMRLHRENAAAREG